MEKSWSEDTSKYFDHKLNCMACSENRRCARSDYLWSLCVTSEAAERLASEWRADDEKMDARYAEARHE